MTLSSYVVAIPTYNRPDEVTNKTLQTLKEGGVTKSRIYLFVANKQQEKLYEEAVPKNLYNKIVVGKKGIANQRNFIVKYFPENQYVVSIDDDVERLEILKGDKLVEMKDVDGFFKEAYKMLKKERLYIWGIYPVRNAFFMKNEVSTDLKFIIGVLRGFINRKTNKLKPSVSSESKEDYEQSILYYKLDGGVLRFNNITPKTKFNAKGGLGQERQEMNRLAANYLKKTYPDIITIFHRDNGMTEVKLARLPRIDT
jgi:hypothetical protein